MIDALEDHVETASIGGRTATNLRFADDTDGLAGDEQELADQEKKISGSYGRKLVLRKPS